jgi:hypothetical protein
VGEDAIAKHERAAAAHHAAADEHDRVAAAWSDRGDTERAGLEFRNALLERQLALPELDRAELERRRARRRDNNIGSPPAGERDDAGSGDS